MTESPWRRHGHWFALALLALATLTQSGSVLRWGDGLELVAAGAQTGVAHPPGYPWFTLLLGAASALAPADPYAAGLWVCRIAACAVAFVVALLVRGILRRHALDERTAVLASSLLGLAFLFSGSLWPTLHVVEVYGFHALALAVVLALLVFVERGPSARTVLAAAAVTGFALAHHLTSAALLPLLGLAIFDPARGGDRRTAVSAVALLVGIPIAWYASLLLRAPAPGDETLVWGGMQNLGALLQHVRGSEYGGAQFLMSDPHTPFTLTTWLDFATGRVGLLLAHVGQMFFGTSPAAPWIGAVLVLLGAVGARGLWRERPRPVLGLLVAIALQVGFVLTYNIADITDYFLAIEVLLLPLMVVGVLGTAARLPGAAGSERSRRLVALAVPALLLAFTVPLHAHTARPASAPLAAQYQSRLLGALPPGAGILTAESGDLFLLWYTRFALEGRRDLCVVPANLLDRPWVRSTLPAGDARRDAVRFDAIDMRSLPAYVAALRAQAIDPMLRHGPVFTTLRTVEVLEALAQYYEFRPVTELLRRDEIERLRADGLPRAPAVLWELRAR